MKYKSDALRNQLRLRNLGLKECDYFIVNDRLQNFGEDTQERYRSVVRNVGTITTLVNGRYLMYLPVWWNSVISNIIGKQTSNRNKQGTSTQFDNGRVKIIRSRSLDCVQIR